MAFKLSKFEIGMIAAFVVVTGAGIGGYIYTSGLVEAAKSDLTTANGELQQLVKQRYMPSASNIKTLESNVNDLLGALQPVEKQILLSPDNKLSQIQAQNPVTWKNSELDQTVQRLTALARSRRVALPADYYFGFARYQKTNPSEQATLILGKQLYGVEQLATKLFELNESGSIAGLRSIRRTFDEDAGGNGAAGDSAEALRGASMVGASKLYRVYPFEVEFVGTTTGLRSFLNGLMKMPALFIVRSVQVTNSKIESPKLSDLGKSSSDKDKAGRDFIFGGEQITVKVRVDMVEWLGTQGADAAGAAKPAQGAKR